MDLSEKVQWKIVLYFTRKDNFVSSKFFLFFLYCLAFSTRLGYEEHIPGQTRDWNEEIQTIRELPRKTLPDRLIRERAIFKVT